MIVMKGASITIAGLLVLLRKLGLKSAYTVNDRYARLAMIESLLTVGMIDVTAAKRLLGLIP